MCVRSLIPLMALAILASACGGNEPQNTSQPTAVSATATAPAASQATPVQRPTATPTAVPKADYQPTAAPVVPTADASQKQSTTSTIDLDAIPIDFKSYRIRLTLSFDGKLQDGEVVKGSSEFIQEVIAETKEQRIRFAVARQGDKRGEDRAAVDRFIVGDANYYYIAEGDNKGKCINVLTDEPANSPITILRPSDLIGDPQNPRLIEKGVIANGVRSDRYAIETPDLKGEVWVAQEGDFVVRYIGEFTSKTALFDEAEGLTTWDYQLETDSVFKIELPEACVAQNLADDIPVPASATDKSQLGDVISFSSSESVQKIIEFYKAEMPKLGWMQGETLQIGDLFLLEFKKDARTIIVALQKEGEGANVLITEQK